MGSSSSKDAVASTSDGVPAARMRGARVFQSFCLGRSSDSSSDNDDQRRGFTIFGKRFLDRKKWTSSSSSSSSSSSYRLRVAHFSAYDKNVDEEMHPNSVPDDVIQPHINNYWAPHPQTGVFGPIDHITSDHQHQPAPAAADGSVLEQQAWFRPLEDVDKPTPP